MEGEILGVKNILQRRFIKIFGAVIILIAGLWLVEFASAWLDWRPTAIVIDAETGKPVEGAIALAQWFRAGGGGMFEGGVDVLDKAVETYSDKEGKIYIRGSWGMHIFSSSPRLTVYKPGYVLWDSRRLCPTDMPRTDFDENHRTVKLLNFDIEAVRWVKEYPNRGRGLPRSMQNLFFSSCYDSGIGRKYSRNEIKFQDIFDKYELPLINAEEMIRRKRGK